LRPAARLFVPAVAAALALTLEPARADVGTAIGAGAFFTSDGQTSAGIVGTLGLGSFPVIPIRPQVSGAYIFTNDGGSYAVTGEGQFGGKAFFAGAGLGFGRIAAHSGGSAFNSCCAPSGVGFVADAFAGLRVAPFTSVQLRYYGSPNGTTGSSTYLGVSFGF
jgi:hypothetical protein